MAPPAAPPRPVLVTEEMITNRDWRRKQRPAYKVSTVAQVFFGMSASWVRLHLGEGSFQVDGEQMEFRRVDPDSSMSARLFLLSDIQPMAEALHAQITPKGNRRISAKRLARVLAVVAAQADLFGLYDDPDDAEVQEEAEDA